MATKKVPMSATEEAYLARVMAQHASEVRMADARKLDAVKVLLTDKGIPTDAAVRTEARTGETPAQLVYEVPALDEAIRRAEEAERALAEARNLFALDERLPADGGYEHIPLASYDAPPEPESLQEEVRNPPALTARGV